MDFALKGLEFGAANAYLVVHLNIILLIARV
jgi:hypothetical protein